MDKETRKVLGFIALRLSKWLAYTSRFWLFGIYMIVPSIFMFLLIIFKGVGNV